MKFLSLLFIVLIVSCTSSRHKNKPDKGQGFSMYDRIEEKNENLFGVKLEMLDVLLNIEDTKSELAILVLSRGDCSSCVEKGYDIICELKGFLQDRVFSISIEDTGDQLPCAIREILDPNESLKRAINIFVTPSIVIVKNRKIVNIFSIYYSPSISETEFVIRKQDFLNSVMTTIGINNSHCK